MRILHRGVPVADLVPVAQTGDEGSGVDRNSEELEGRGMVKRGQARASAQLDKQGPRVRGKSIVDTLLDERH